jgi:hypothetical protein
MEKSQPLAEKIRDGASVGVVAGFILCLAAPLRARQPRDRGLELTSSVSDVR